MPTPTMRKKTVNVPGIGELELYFGPGDIRISDLDGAANVIVQGYTAQELIAATAEGRKAVPVTGMDHPAPLTGDAYHAFLAAHPEIYDALLQAAWEVQESILDGDPPADGQPDTRVNYWVDAVPTFGPGHDVAGG